MRTRILTAALHQMNTHGIKFTTVDLARDLGVSKRAIYEHFPSKNLLLSAVVETILADLKQQISGIVQDESLDTIEKLKALMLFNPKALGPINVRVIDDVKRYLPDEYAKFDACFEERWGMLEEVIKQGVQKGFLAKVDLLILRRIYMGTIDQLIDDQFLNQNNTTFKNAMTKATEILIWGLMPREGQKPKECLHPTKPE